VSIRDADVAVVGLGAVGSMALWRLAERGLTVHGYERFGIGHDRGAFSGQTRRFSVQSQREPRWTPLAMAALDLWRELEVATGRSLLNLTGGVILGPADTPALVGARQSAVDTELVHEVLSADALRDRFPQHLVRPTDLGVLDPMAGFVRPEPAVVGAVRHARSLGATVFDHTRVTSVEADGVVRTSGGGTRRYGHVIVAPGARARDILGLARRTVLPRRPVQGWYLPYDVKGYGADVFPVFERVGEVNMYGFPTVDGATVKVGVYTSGHPVVYDTEQLPLTVGSALLKHFRRTMAVYLPGLHPEPVATTVNLEGYTTDGQPLVGPAPGASRILVACGFSGAGFKFAPVIGDVLADLVSGEHTTHDIGFLAPDRPLAPWPADATTPA
jgi:sarcosine oxidase